MKITATPSARNWRITSNSTVTSRSSSEEVGSSMMTSWALNETARAMATICWIAVEYSISGRLTSILTAKRLSSSAASRASAPIEQPETPMLAAEKNVLGDRAERHQVDLLVDRADAAALGRLGRSKFDRLAGERDRAGIAAVGARQHLDQRRLAGAVLADQRHDLAGLDLELRGVQRLGSVKMLVDVAHDEQRAEACVDSFAKSQRELKM